MSGMFPLLMFNGSVKFIIKIKIHIHVSDMKIVV